MSCLTLLALSGCGDDSSSAGSGELPVAGKLAAAERTKPQIPPPSGPLPTELVLNDLIEGAGPEVEEGDELTVEYVVVNKKGKERFSSWDNPDPFTFTLGAEDYFPGWEQGFDGMKVGGRRELVIPAKLTDGRGFMLYVVDLRRIE